MIINIITIIITTSIVIITTIIINALFFSFFTQILWTGYNNKTHKVHILFV